MSVITPDDVRRIMEDPELTQSFNVTSSHSIFESTDPDAYVRDLSTCSDSCQATVDSWLAEHPVAPFVAPTRVADLQVGDSVQLDGTPERRGDWSTGQRGNVVTVREINGERAWITDPLGSASYVDDVNWPFVFVSRPGVETPEVAPEIEPTPIADVVADRVTLSRAEFDRLTREANREFSEYHERMRPMFERTARVANAAGFCSEYDRVAAAVGAPSREDFIRNDYTFSIEVEIRRTVTVLVNATGSDPEDAWDAIEDADIRDSLDADGIEYDSIEYNGYDDYTVEES